MTSVARPAASSDAVLRRRNRSRRGAAARSGSDGSSACDGSWRSRRGGISWSVKSWRGGTARSGIGWRGDTDGDWSEYTSVS